MSAPISARMFTSVGESRVPATMAKSTWRKRWRSRCAATRTAGGEERDARGLGVLGFERVHGGLHCGDGPRVVIGVLGCLRIGGVDGQIGAGQRRIERKRELASATGVRAGGTVKVDQAFGGDAARREVVADQAAELSRRGPAESFGEAAREAFKDSRGETDADGDHEPGNGFTIRPPRSPSALRRSARFRGGAVKSEFLAVDAALEPESIHAHATGFMQLL